MNIGRILDPTIRETTMSGSDLVVLRGGLAVPLSALRLVWMLEDRGCHLVLDADDVLRVGPGELLSDDDRHAIRRWRSYVVAIVRYVEAIQ